MESLLTKARGEESKERLAYSAGLVAYRASAATRAAELLVPILTSKDTNLARDARYALGLVRGKEGRWEESAALLEPLLEEELPLETARGVLMHLAESLARLEADESQTRRWKEFVDVVARRNADLLVDVGNRAYDRDRPAWAALAFDRRLETAADPPQRLPALLGAGWSWYQVGDRSQAAARFTQAAETAAAGSAEQAEALSMLATIAQADGDSSRALRLFRRVHEEFPTSPFAGSAARKAAKILSEMGNANDADALYQNLADRLAAGPERARVSYERAWLAMDRNDLAAAEQYFLQSVTEAGPGSIAVESALKLAEICQQRGKLPEAKEFLDRAESLGPGDELLPAVAYRRGLLERAMGHDESARSALRQLVDRWPDSSFAAASLYTLGELAFESESPDDAMADFQRLIALPTAGKYGPLAQLRLAQVHLKRSRWDDADQEAAKLAEDSVDRPVREEAVYVRARVLQQRADFDKARELYRSIIGPERTETAAKAQFMIGETYFFQERFDDALKELLKVEILYPIPEWQSLALLEVGKCHDRKGERDAARKAYEDVVTKYGQQPAAAEAKRLLESTTQRAEVKPTP
jgi:TolA-binding protein